MALCILSGTGQKNSLKSYIHKDSPITTEQYYQLHTIIISYYSGYQHSTCTANVYIWMKCSNKNILMSIFQVYHSSRCVPHLKCILCNTHKLCFLMPKQWCLCTGGNVMKSRNRYNKLCNIPEIHNQLKFHHNVNNASKHH